MRNPYSKPLFEIYQNARNFADELKPIVLELMDGDGAFAMTRMQARRRMSVEINSNTRTFRNSKELVDASQKLDEACSELTAKASAILEQIPQVSFLIRFNEAKPESSILEQYKDYSFTGDMNGFLTKYDNYVGKTEELAKIIEDYEKTTYESEGKVDPLTMSQRETAYRLVYDTMSGRLYVNDKEIYKCNLDSKLDKALNNAFKAPNKPVKASGNLASAISAIRAPESLKRLMFRTSKSSFQVHPEITADDLKQNKLTKEIVEQEFQKLSK